MHASICVLFRCKERAKLGFYEEIVKSYNIKANSITYDIWD